METNTSINIITSEVARNKSIQVNADSIDIQSDVSIHFDYAKQVQAANEVREKLGAMDKAVLMELLSNALLGLHNYDYREEMESETDELPIPAVALSFYYCINTESDSDRCTDVFIDVSPLDFEK